MGLRFVVEEGVADAGDNETFLVRQRAHRAALGTGLLAAEVLGRLPLCRHLEGAGEQGLHRRHGDFFHLCEGDLGTGTLLAPVPLDDDFPPVVSEFLNAAKILRCEFVCCHDASLQEVP